MTKVLLKTEKKIKIKSIHDANYLRDEFIYNQSLFISGPFDL